MGKQRSDSQAVEAFSAPKDLLQHARRRAVSLGMTMSGYLRYVVALEIGYSEADARDLALHPSVHQLRLPSRRSRSQTRSAPGLALPQRQQAD